MQNESFLEKVATPLQHRASVQNVFGEPVTTQGKTIIPVAQIAFGFGGGFGRGDQATGAGKAVLKDGEGGGGGGGMYARPRGVFEISEAGTRFIPVRPARHLLLAALAGFFIRGFFFGKKK